MLFSDRWSLSANDTYLSARNRLPDRDSGNPGNRPRPGFYIPILKHVMLRQILGCEYGVSMPGCELWFQV